MTIQPETGSLGDQIRRLGPWHQDIQLTEEFSTGQVFSPDGRLSREANRNVSLLTLRNNFVEHILDVYPEGLRGKRFLDCACNAGGYCFWARELGSDFSFGFDIRDHWIEQAKFVQQHRTVAPTDRIKFSVCDLYALQEKRLPQFDVTLFKGIFYHLPDPITGLKTASDLTREILIFNTQTGWGEPDGFLKPGLEDTRALMSGAYGLNWRPTGPATMIPVLKWLGYRSAKLMFFRQQKNNPDGNLGRMEIWATKVSGLLDKYETQRTLFEE